jgi:hypothetical protein
MNHATKLLVCGMAAFALSAVAPYAAHAVETPVIQEHVTGGDLDLVWVPGFYTPVRNMQALTLTAADPGYLNPSGDHTVAVATNTIPDSGGIILTCTDPGVFNTDYSWEGWMFTGDGNTRRGLVVRADPTIDFTACYQFVVQAGLLQINFRRLDGQTATTLGTWFSTSLPDWGGGVMPTNTWIHMKVMATGGSFRCWINGTELTSGGPIVDPTPLLTGWVGAYNFRFDTGLVPAYFDDLILSVDAATPTTKVTWGGVKARYR